MECNHLFQSLCSQPPLHPLQLWTNSHSPNKQAASPGYSFNSSLVGPTPLLLIKLLIKCFYSREERFYPILSQAQFCMAFFFLSFRFAITSDTFDLHLLLRKLLQEVSVMAQWVKDQQDEGSILVITQWIKDPELLQTAVLAADVARFRWGCGCGVGPSCSSNSSPGLGTSTCHMCSHKKKKKKKREREREKDIKKLLQTMNYDIILQSTR